MKTSIIQKGFIHQRGVHLARAVVMVGILWNIPTFAQTVVRRSPFTRGAVTMTQVELSAAEAALIPEGLRAVPLYAPESLPFSGTFYSLQITNYPPFPGNIFNLPCWSLGDGIFLLNDLSFDYEALRQEAEAEKAASRSMMNNSGPPGPGEGGGEGGGGGYSEFLGQIFTTNDLWLELVQRTNATGYFVIHPPWNVTNEMYDLFMTTNLSADVPGLNLTNWLWLLRTEAGQTNLTVTNLADEIAFFRLGTMTDSDADDLTDAFENLVSHTDPNNGDQNTNGIPDGWEWKYFGNLNQTAEGDYDGDGVDNGTEYTNTTNPNTIVFSMAVTNFYVNSSSVPVTLALQNGHPSYLAVLVNNTNLAAANWQPYTSSNLSVALETHDGDYTVAVGLKGLPADAEQTWNNITLTRDTVPPKLVISSPTPGSSTARPYVQLLGSSDERLTGISYDLTNALGVLLNEPGYVVNQHFDTNQFDFTTNYFQCYDVPLATNANQFAIRVTDRAGNTTTTNFIFTLDYALATNPVVLQVVWPQPGMAVSGTEFTLRGWLNDETATVTAQIVTTNGGTNILTGLVERGGAFWVEALPLADGPNQLTVTAVDAAGLNTTVTNFTVVKSGVVVTIDSTPGGMDLYQAVGNVSGTVSDPSYAVFINGMAATMNGTSWNAANVPIQSSGTATFTATATNASGGGSNQLVSVAKEVEMPPAVVIVEHHVGKTNQATWGNYADTDIRMKDYLADYQTNALGQWVLQGYHGNSRNRWITTADGVSEFYAYDYEWTATNASSHYYSDSVRYGYDYYYPYIDVENATARELLLGIPDSEITAGNSEDGYYYIYNYYAAGVSHRWTDEYGTDYEASVTARTYLKLFTGGKALMRRQNLFRLHCDRAEIYGRPAEYPWQETPGSEAVPSYTDPATLRLGGLWMGQDGNLWVALPDNAAVDATVSAPARHFNASISPTKYTLSITAASSTTNANLDTVIPEFCVGQLVSFVPSWSPQTPLYMDDSTFFWHLPGKFVNEEYPYSSYCNSFRRNDDLLTNRTISCWYVNQPGGPCSTRQTLHFANGQMATIMAAGEFTVYRPAATNEVEDPGVVSLDGNFFLQDAPVDFFGHVQSAYHGVANWTQLINRNCQQAFYILTGTGNQYWLDTHLFYNQNSVDVGPSLNNRVPLQDAPEVPIDVHVSNADSFKTYLMFKPDGGSNIYVPLGLTDWGWHGSAYPGLLGNHGISSPQYDLTDEFPLWPDIYYSSGQ